MEENGDNKLSISIPEFFEGKSVFVTGFTGALGKVLVEKIMYSCPDVNKIYVLIRPKKGLSPEKRMKETLKSMAFRRIWDKYPGMLESKVIGISGDLLADRLGLSHEDEELLKREVSIIIHGGATVRFDNPFDVAFNQNTMGVKKMVDLALTMPKLESFIFISTAYSNSDHLHIEEKIYPPKEDWRNLEKILQKIDTATVRILSDKYIDKLPNTYIFSKCLSEDVINEQRNQLPVAVVRPSVVIPASKEPVPGWTDNQYGPITYVLGFLFGIIRCGWVDLKQIVNYIASDVVVNATLVLTWKTALQYNASQIKDSVPVVNICAPPSILVDNHEFSKMYKTKKGIVNELNRNNINRISLMFAKNRIWYRINIFFRHFIPAAIIDFILVLLKKSPVLLSIRRKVYFATESLAYFGMQTFSFEITNSDKLLKDIRPEDKESFGWDFKTIDIADIYYGAFQELKHTLLKQLYDDLPTNRKRLLMLYVIDHGVVVLTYCLLGWFMYTIRLPQCLFTFFTGINV